MKNERIDFTSALFQNYFKVTLRKIRRQKGYAIINVSGLAVGLACCTIMLLWAAKDWLSSFTYQFNPGIGILLITVFATLIIALTAVGYQSLKAAMANPVDSLRHE